MSLNTFGQLFRMTSWGESHGAGDRLRRRRLPARHPAQRSRYSALLDKRRPGQSKYTTQRKEPDTVKILSGVFDNGEGTQVTTGTPISLMIENVDARSKDYSDIKDKFRPGHADYTYLAKYGVRDYRGSGRQSARETAARVAAGAIARKVIASLYKKAVIRGALVQIGDHIIERERWDWAQVDENPFFCPDPGVINQWTDYLEGVRKSGSSVGAIIEVVAEGIPAGLGAPIYGKLDADLASGDDGHQCRQGRRDRRGLCGRRAVRRRQCRRDAQRAAAGRNFFPITRAEF